MPVTLQSPFGVQCKPYGEARSAEFWLGNDFDTFKKFIGFLKIFEPRKCFILRREIRIISLGVQLILFPFIGVSKSLELFKNLKGFSILFLLQNVLFDGWDGLDGLDGLTG